MIKKAMAKIWQYIAKKNDKAFRAGCDFSEWVLQKDMGFEADKGNQYQPSSDGLKKVLKKCNISKEDAIVDIGCGKGKAMYLMSQFPFGKIEGYDLNPLLVTIAKENFTTMGLDRCRVFVADAESFDEYDVYNYFYFYNPVPKQVFEKTLAHIEESINRSPRKCTIIYHNPVYDEIILSKTKFARTKRKKSIIPWFDFYCYERN